MEDISAGFDDLACPIKKEPSESSNINLTNMTDVTCVIKQEPPEECLTNITGCTCGIKQEFPEESITNINDNTSGTKQELPEGGITTNSGNTIVIKQEPPEECLTNITNCTCGIKQEFPEESITNISDNTNGFKQDLVEENMNINDIANSIKKKPLDVMVKNINKHRQILVDMGLGRIKDFFVHSGSSLRDQFCCYVNSDPAFSEILSHSFPVLKEFNAKLESWVDMNSEENLKDGAVVRAVFFPNRLETDETKLEAIKRKRDDSESDGAPKNKVQCICPKRHEQTSISFNVSTQFNEADSSKGVLSIGQPIKTELKNSPLKDGAVVSAVFFPNRLETDETEPGAIKRKRDDSDSDSAPKNKVQCICPKHHKQTTVSFNVSTQFNETDSSKGVLSIGQPIKTELKNSPLKEIQEKKIFVIKESPQIKSSNADKTLQLINSPIREAPQNVKAEPLKKLEHDVKNCLKSENPYSTFHVSSADVKKSQSGCIQPNAVEQTCNNNSDVQFTSPIISGADAQCISKEPNSLKQIKWGYHPLRLRHASVRLKWGKNVIHENWSNTMFIDVFAFTLHNKQIKQSLVIKKSTELFWVCLTLSGPQIIVPVSSSYDDIALLQILKDKFVNVKNETEIDGVRVQAMFNETHFFKQRFVKQFFKESNILVSCWPISARNISPIFHARRLLEEKVGTVYCSSKEEMISIISQV